MICDGLCAVNSWIIFPGFQNELPMAEWKFIRQPNFSHAADNQMIIIFQPLTLVTVPSLLNLSLRSCLTSWTGMAENFISLLLVLCCYISGRVHTCSSKELTTRWSQSQPNPAYVFKICFPKVYVNIVLPFVLVPESILLPLCFTANICMTFWCFQTSFVFHCYPIRVCRPT
jgi:hypothetical protein